MKPDFYGLLLLFFCLIGFGLLPAWAETVEKPALILGQGEQRILRVPGLARYSLGSELVRALKGAAAGEDRILIKGITAGQSDLWVWKSDGSTEHRLIQVEKISSSEIAPSLAKALSRLEEAEIIYSGTGAVLRGNIGSFGENARIAALVRGFPKEIIDQTTPSEPLLEEARKKLDAALARRDFTKNFRTERVGDELWVRGSVESTGEQTAILKTVEAIFPRARTEILSLPDNAPTVHFKVFLLELKKSRFGSFGISWPAAQEGAFQVTSTHIYDRLALDTTLQAMEGDGSVRILSKPELVVRAPGEAELFAGGELPLLTKNRFFSNVNWKNYGLTLKLHVTHSTRDQVRVDIFTEVSHLDSTSSVENIPGIQSNRMKTQVDARYGVPLLLSGLLQQGTRENAKGLPLLRQIPVLGPLFGSEDYLNERSELVAILLPSLTPPTAPMERVDSSQPRGPAPVPRNWLSPSQIQALKRSPEYPWNAFSVN